MSMKTLPSRAHWRKSVPLTPSIALLAALLWLLAAAGAHAQSFSVLGGGLRDRIARRIAKANDRGEAGTEDLREAMLHYRELFEDLLQTGTKLPTQEEVLASA
jgi:hypothetical protein